ncbi:PAS domain S-box-containing protein [Roseomonas rosea]|uniref:PAS domain S-box-containing protein n=1 Tax=Muricoccus roseus TaxID=198092 RepID=A0A1M6P0Z3_9PROT|nr:PAS domain S-box protein [Roseomonas rosea]SHK01570.1 PAS domain S-box-containing protein [Roseomonas rosea]
MLSQPFGQALADEDGQFTQVNRVFCELLGYEMSALLQRTIHDITHPDDWPGNSHKLERLRAEDEPFTIVKRHVRSDGAVVWVQNYVSMLRDRNGRATISALIRPVLPAVGEAQRWGGEKPAPLAQTELEALLRPILRPGEALH